MLVVVDVFLLLHDFVINAFELFLQLALRILQGVVTVQDVGNFGKFVAVFVSDVFKEVVVFLGRGLLVFDAVGLGL